MFSLTLEGLGLPSDPKGLDRQRIKILGEDEQCAHGIPPPEVSGIRCTNAFTCSPKPARGSRREATWDNITIAESKVLVPYKVCWCGGECWDSANWAETPGRLLTNDAAYVWHSSVPPPLTRKDVPVIKVTRRPFATTTAVSSWRLKLVRSVFSCDLLGDPELCGGLAAPDCGFAMSVGPDEGTWEIPIGVGVVPGDYKVCLDDGSRHWVQIASAESLYLEFDRLPQDSTHPAGLFHEQRVSAFRDEMGEKMSKIELKGYKMIEPFPGRLGVSYTPCGLELPFIIDTATFTPVRGESDEETAIFEADLSDLDPGEYHLCYCSEDDYEPLQYTEYEVQTVIPPSALGAAAADLCIN